MNKIRHLSRQLLRQFITSIIKMFSWKLKLCSDTVRVKNNQSLDDRFYNEDGILNGLSQAKLLDQWTISFDVEALSLELQEIFSGGANSDYFQMIEI